MTTSSSNLVNIGRITAVFGVKGWVKIHSYTEPAENVLIYNPWWLKTAHGVKPVEIDEARPHGKGYVAHIKGVDDRDQAALYTGAEIAVDRSQLPALEEGDYYWRDLQGLAVVTEFEGREQRLGRIARMLETGANDVMVVVADEQSLDQRERLIPYLPGQFVKTVDLARGEMRVDWDPEF